MLKVREIIGNTRKNHFGSNGIEWMLHNFGTLEIVHLGPKHEFFIFDVPMVSKII
jgi:hypothetical protein